MSNLIDWTKPVVDPRNNLWRVLCTDSPNTSYPVILMREKDGMIMEVHTNGVGLGRGWVFRNIPARNEGWINIYPSREAGHIYSSKASADANQELGRVACAHIEWEE